MLPGNVEVTIYDIGKAIALWVSAFEILAHPGTPNVGLQAGLPDAGESKMESGRLQSSAI